MTEQAKKLHTHYYGELQYNENKNCKKCQFLEKKIAWVYDNGDISHLYQCQGNNNTVKKIRYRTIVHYQEYDFTIMHCKKFKKKIIKKDLFDGLY
jgi:hypothetical protein